MRRSGHTLDWEIKPLPFKVYPAIEPIRLPTALPSLATDTFAALAGGEPSAGPAPLDLERLAALLFFSAGVTRVKTYPGGGQVHFRAAPSTGALYQTEAYVVAGDVRGLEAGVYHFSPGDFSLRRLRAGDFRRALAEAAADEAIAGAPASIVLSAIYWRNTWKYQARGYRHLFWDSGTLLAQLLATARALGEAIMLSLQAARQVPGAEPGDPPPPASVLLISDGAQTQGRLTPVGAARRARAAGIPVYTISLGTPDGIVERQLPGGYTERVRVPPDPTALRQVALTSGGELFTAADEEHLRRVYDELGSRLGSREKDAEITVAFAGAGLVLLLLAGGLSTALFRRLP